MFCYLREMFLFWFLNSLLYTRSVFCVGFCRYWRVSALNDTLASFIFILKALLKEKLNSLGNYFAKFRYFSGSRFLPQVHQGLTFKLPGGWSLYLYWDLSGRERLWGQARMESQVKKTNHYTFSCWNDHTKGMEDAYRMEQGVYFCILPDSLSLSALLCCLHL